MGVISSVLQCLSFNAENRQTPICGAAGGDAMIPAAPHLDGLEVILQRQLEEAWIGREVPNKTRPVICPAFEPVIPLFDEALAVSAQSIQRNFVQGRSMGRERDSHAGRAGSATAAPQVKS
jgi:hypothetical protein